MIVIKRSLFFFIFIVQLACETTPYQRGPAGISTNHAVNSLSIEAQKMRDQGLLENAKASLERALRIEPNNAFLWFDLATLHDLTGDKISAKSLALRALNFSQSPSLTRRIEAFIDMI